MASPRPRSAAAPARALCLAAALLTVGCIGTRTAADPTLVIETPAGSELGVSSDYGVVFLGRTARAGRATVTAWFGDGPSREPAVIVPLGDGLFTAEVEIRLPSVPLAFQPPRPGEPVTVVGRRGARTWVREARVRSDPSVEGILLDADGIEGGNDQAGAGVYLGSGRDRRLVGLVSGRLRIAGTDGSSREYLTVVGPDTLWRLVAQPRDTQRKRRWVYREDIL